MDHLNSEEKFHVEELVEKYSDQFYLEGDEIGCTDVLTHRIHLTHDVPIREKQYKIPYNLRQEVDRQVEQLYKNGIIQPSESPYQSPIRMVPKNRIFREIQDGVLSWIFAKLTRLKLETHFPTRDAILL